MTSVVARFEGMYNTFILDPDVHWRHISDIHNLQSQFQYSSESQSESQSEVTGSAVAMHYAEQHPEEFANSVFS